MVLCIGVSADWINFSNYTFLWWWSFMLVLLEQWCLVMGINSWWHVIWLLISMGMGVWGWECGFFSTFQCEDLLTEWMFECNKMVLVNVNSWEKYMAIYLLRESWWGKVIATVIYHFFDMIALCFHARKLNLPYCSVMDFPSFIGGCVTALAMLWCGSSFVFLDWWYWAWLFR